MKTKQSHCRSITATVDTAKVVIDIAVAAIAIRNCRRCHRRSIVAIAVAILAKVHTAKVFIDIAVAVKHVTDNAVAPIDGAYMSLP